MILDIANQMSDAQALTATAVSTDVLDLDNDDNIGKGEPMAVVIPVTVAADFTSANETYQFTVQTDTVENFASPTVVTETGAINGDVLTAGYKVVLPLGHYNERYLRVNYTLAGTTPSVTVDAYLVPLSDIDSWEPNASGYSI